MSTAESTQIIGTAYLTTLQGVCKFVEVVCSFISVLLVGGNIIRFYESAAALSIIFAVIFLVLYVTGAVARVPLPWNRIQFFVHGILSIYYIIAAALVLDYGFAKLIAGGIFGLLATIAHIVDAYDNYKKHPLITT